MGVLCAIAARARGSVVRPVHKVSRRVRTADAGACMVWSHGKYSMENGQRYVMCKISVPRLYQKCFQYFRVKTA